MNTTHSTIVKNYEEYKNATSLSDYNESNVFLQLDNLLKSYCPTYKISYPNLNDLLKEIGLKSIMERIIDPDIYLKMISNEHFKSIENDEKIFDYLNGFFDDSLKVNPNKFKKFTKYLNQKKVIDDQTYKSITEKLARIENLNRSIRNKTSKFFGVSCFSTSKSEILMWSHYADKHRGFVIEYDLRSFITRHPITPFITPVVYSKNRTISEIFLKNDIVKDTLSSEMIGEDIIKGLITKSKIWSYEKEWRIINVIQDPNGQLLSFPYAKWVYVGSEMSSPHIEILKNLCAQKNIGLSQNILDERIYKIQKKYKVLLKPEKTVKSPKKGNLEMKTIEKKDLPKILYSILTDLGGSANMLTVFKEFYRVYGPQIKEDNPLFYTWNYDIRWAATTLRKQGIMAPAKKNENSHGEDITAKGIWALKEVQ